MSVCERAHSSMQACSHLLRKVLMQCACCFDMCILCVCVCVCVCPCMHSSVRSPLLSSYARRWAGRLAVALFLVSFVAAFSLAGAYRVSTTQAGSSATHFAPEGCACSQTQTHALRGPALLHLRPSHSDRRVRWRGRAPISSHPGGGAGKGAELPADAPAQSCGHGVPLRQSGGVDQRHLDLCRFAPSS